MPTDVQYEVHREVLGKWRKAVSLTEGDNGEFFLHRYDKKQERWVQLLYFRTFDDLDEFIDFLDEMVADDDDEDEED